MPELVIERTSGVWNKYLWLKTVRGVNLSVHCYSSLVGDPLHVHNTARRQHLRTLPEVPALYLCGVTEPYRWELNSHVLMVPDRSPRDWVVVETPTLRVALWGLQAVPITPDHLPGEVYGGRRDFVTCRNLQAAWLLHREFGLRNEPGRTPKLAAHQAKRPSGGRRRLTTKRGGRA